MMICKADFDELFPSLQRYRRDHAPCADDVQDAAPSRPDESAWEVPDPVRAGFALAAMPAAAAYGAAWAMGGVYDRWANG